VTCSACGHENPSGARFCQRCGRPAATPCPRCGTELPPTARFCHDCGQPIEAPAGARPASPAVYTPKHLAEKILTGRAALEGERKQVTVLFADVKGSLELAEQVDPEEWHRVLDRFS